MDRSVYNHYGVGWGGYEESSTRTSNYKKLLASGQRLPNNSYYWYRVDGSSGLYQTYNGLLDGRSGMGQGSFRTIAEGGSLVTPTGAPSNVTDSIDRIHTILGNKLLMKARNSPVNLGVALGEYRETAEFFVGACKAIRALRRPLVGHDIGEALAYLGRTKATVAGKAAANAWLQWTYAVKPLMSDVYGSVSVLASPEQYLEIKRVSAGHTAHISASSIGPNNGGKYSQVAKGDLKGRGRLTFVVDNPLFFSLDQLGITNPISVAYELIPYSFVLDWFIPVGNLLQNISPPHGVRFLEGFTSVHGKGSYVGETEIHYIEFRKHYDWYTKCSTREVIKSRKAFRGFPSYQLLIPDLSLSKSRIASALALITQGADRIRH